MGRGGEKTCRAIIRHAWDENRGCLKVTVIVHPIPHRYTKKWNLERYTFWRNDLSDLKSGLEEIHILDKRFKRKMNCTIIKVSDVHMAYYSSFWVFYYLGITPKDL